MNYQLIIKIPFEALDDIEAREKAKGILNGTVHKEKSEIKLQAVFPNKPPVKVTI
jgi:hypothetical protein